MRAGTERQVPAGARLPGRERVRRRGHRRVAPGGGEVDQHDGAGPDRPPGQLRVPGRHPPPGHDRRHQPEPFLDHTGGRDGAGGQIPQRLRLGREPVQQPGQELRGGLLAGDQQEEQGADGGVRRQPVPVGVLAQPAHHAAGPVRVAAQHRVVAPDHLGQRALPVAIQRGPEQLQRRPRELLDHGGVRIRQLHQPGQDQQRQVRGQVRVQVHRRAGAQRGRQRRHPAPHHTGQPGPLPRHPIRVQGLGHDRAEPRMARGAVVGQGARQPETVPGQDPQGRDRDRGDRVQGVVRAERVRVGEHAPHQGGVGHHQVRHAQRSRSGSPLLSVPPLARTTMPSISGHMLPNPQVSQVTRIWAMPMPTWPV